MIIVDVLAITAMQRDLPRDVLGRVLGVFDALVIGAIVLASFLAATLLSLTSLTTTLIAISTVIPGIALVFLPVLLRMDRETAAVADRLRPRVELLSALDLLTGVDRTTLERLAAHADERVVSASTVLLQQGEDADALDPGQRLADGARTGRRRHRPAVADREGARLRRRAGTAAQDAAHRDGPGTRGQHAAARRRQRLPRGAGRWSGQRVAALDRRHPAGPDHSAAGP